ncbi:sodium-dependent bicarbonate transport family permease [Oryzomicrobium sp.]|uniref:sodium-dependent bicarbonate transport family permease n=1 Tax=Oryzomicrobium sp. TaxID=1911578 RepID=UPI002FE14075
MDAIPLFFLLGVIARFSASDLKIPAAVHETLSVFLLLTIGLKGGVELARQDVLTILPQALAALSLGLLLPLLAYPLLRRRFGRPDAAAIAGHYGSVSVVTYAVASSFLAARDVEFEAYLPLFVVLLEAPGVITGVLLANARGGRSLFDAHLLREVFAGKSVLLLIGGLAIGWIAGPAGTEPLAPFFFNLFKGALCLFLLEMGLVAASRVAEVRKSGAFLLAFGMLFPLLAAGVGLALGALAGLSLGGCVMLMTLAASASYIAAPAAMRIAVPEANPALSIGLALGITFPFNVVVGVPLYLAAATQVFSLLNRG